MIQAILGFKIDQTQDFDQQGKRIPLTIVNAGPCPVVGLKKIDDQNQYQITIGFGQRKEKNTPKPILGIIKKAGLKKIPRFLKSFNLDKGDLKIGQEIKINDIFKEGDLIDVTGTSKGKGFAGVMKRHGFAGGPRTHGQSDRMRAPGSIGQTTTPGRVYKGKKMAGRMGNQKVTIKNLRVIKIDQEKNILTIKGLVPGGKNSLVIIKKSTRTDKKQNNNQPTND